MNTHLFAYGTLLVPEIWTLVVGESSLSKPATLSGHEIFRVKGGDFPGLVASKKTGASVPGRVFLDLNPEAVARLDAYEDTFYERLPVNVTLTDSGEAFSCDSYIVPRAAAVEVLSNEIWTLEWFQAEAQTDYIRRMLGAGF